jgi:hypothetical protein
MESERVAETTARRHRITYLRLLRADQDGADGRTAIWLVVAACSLKAWPPKFRSKARLRTHPELSHGDFQNREAASAFYSGADGHRPILIALSAANVYHIGRIRRG